MVGDAYWLLTAQPVFDFASTMMQMAAHLRDRPLPPSSLGIDLPSDLEAMVLSCLAKQPSRRPTASKLAEELESLPAAGDWSVDRARLWWHEHLPSPL